MEELKEFWCGVRIEVPHTLGGWAVVKLALTCTSNDLPATRKLCGFAGHSASLGCSKCLYKFRSGIFTNKLDYSGYDRNSWPVRTLEEHKVNSLNYLMQKTASGQQAIVSDFGVRYSILQELPYFDPIRYHVIDPMHNLLLGTSIMMMHMWIDCGIITKHSLSVIEERVRAISTAKNIGWLPYADQWRNWTIIFSPVVLKGLLPSQHLRCWLLFVKACSLLCRRIIYSNIC